MENRRPYWQVALRLLFSLLATAAFIIIGLRLIVFLMPFVIGWIIASIAAPLVNWLEKRLKIVKKLGSALIVILVIVLIALALYFGISRIVTEVGDLVRNFPELYAQLEEGLRQIGGTLSGLFERLPEGIQNGWNTVAQLRSSTETILTVMNDSLVQMALDPELQSFSDRYELLDIFDREELYQRLYQFRAVNRFIEKLYIHYYVNNMVLDLNGKDPRLVPLEQADDRERIAAATELTLAERYDYPITLFNLAGEGEETILYVTKPASPIAHKPSAVIVVTLRQSYLQEILQAISLDPACGLYVTDRNGRYLFGKNGDALADGDKYAIEIASADTGWTFLTDPDGKGEQTGFAEGKFGGRTPRPIKTGMIWEDQGVTEKNPYLESDPYSAYDGYGWYFTELNLDKIPSGTIYLHVNGIRDIATFKRTEHQTTLFLNGKKMPDAIGIYNAYLGGRGARLWKLDAGKILKKGKNRIAIRIYNSSGAGGIHRNPVRFEFEGKNSDLLFPYEFNESKYTNDFFWCW